MWSGKCGNGLIWPSESAISSLGISDVYVCETPARKKKKPNTVAILRNVGLHGLSNLKTTHTHNPQRLWWVLPVSETPMHTCYQKHVHFYTLCSSEGTTDRRRKAGGQIGGMRHGRPCWEFQQQRETTCRSMLLTSSSERQGGAEVSENWCRRTDVRFGSETQDACRWRSAKVSTPCFIYSSAEALRRVRFPSVSDVILNNVL